VITWARQPDPPAQTQPACTPDRHEDYGPSADVWSFGVMMFEIITRQKPYSHTFMTPVQIALAVSGDKLRPNLPAYLPANLAKVVNDCCDFDATRRPLFSVVVRALEAIIPELKSRVSSERRCVWFGGWSAGLQSLQCTCLGVDQELTSCFYHRVVLIHPTPLLSTHTLFHQTGVQGPQARPQLPPLLQPDWSWQRQHQQRHQQVIVADHADDGLQQTSTIKTSASPRLQSEPGLEPVLL